MRFARRLLDVVLCFNGVLYVPMKRGCAERGVCVKLSGRKLWRSDLSILRSTRRARTQGGRVCWVDLSIGIAHSISNFRYEKKRRRDGIGELGSASEHL